MIKIIAFDADDTLWENEIYFHQSRERFFRLLKGFASKEEIISEFEYIEKLNVKVYGYGIKSHTLSMIETALKLSNNTISSEIISQVLYTGKDLFNKPLDIFDMVEEVLKELFCYYELIIITKGDLLDQNRKIEDSGLQKYFRKSFVVSEKTEKEYSNIISEMGCSENEFLMVGNSLRSDIIPVLNIGGYGVYIPHNYVCHHERVEEDIQHDNLFHISDISEILSLNILNSFADINSKNGN